MRLPDGDVFIHATAQHLRADGGDVEGNGIVPIVEILTDRKSLLKGNDAVLAAAIEWLRTVHLERVGP